MLCATCGSEVSSTFKHAIARNECPACGGLIMDEESMALIESIGRTILESAAVREETAHSIALAIVAKYDIHNMEKMVHNAPPNPLNRILQPKVAPPSTMKQVMQEKVENRAVISPSIPEGISDAEREKIMEDAVRKKYTIVDQLQVEAANMFPSSEIDLGDDMPTINSVFTEGAANPILEQERISRLSKQKRAMVGGGEGSFRRSG
jgi:Zn-finger nucleic acid-binding protein